MDVRGKPNSLWGSEEEGTLMEYTIFLRKTSKIVGIPFGLTQEWAGLVPVASDLSCGCRILSRHRNVTEFGSQGASINIVAEQEDY